MIVNFYGLMKRFGSENKPHNGLSAGRDNDRLCLRRKTLRDGLDEIRGRDQGGEMRFAGGIRGLRQVSSCFILTDGDWRGGNRTAGRIDYIDDQRATEFLASNIRNGQAQP